MSPSGRCAHRYQSQRLPHRHEYHSPVSPAQPARLHPIRQLLRPVCSPPLLFQCHSKGAALNRPEATIQATRPESVEEKNEFLNLVRSNEDMGKDYIIELTPPTTEENRNVVHSQRSYPRMPTPMPCSLQPPCVRVEKMIALYRKAGAQSCPKALETCGLG